MKELVLPVPETVSATYIVPVPAPMSTVEARRQAGKAVEARLTGPLRTLTAEWLAMGAVKIEVEPAGRPPPGLLDKPLFGTPDQRRVIDEYRSRMIAAARKHGKDVAMLVHSVEDAKRWIQAGVKIIVYASDADLLKNGFTGVVKQLR